MTQRKAPPRKPMTPQELRHWRVDLKHWTQDEAAKALGVSKTHYVTLERGTRADGYDATISRTIALACAALALGVEDYPPR